MLKKSTVAFFLSLFLPFVVHASSIHLPQTGQATCYDAVGSVIPCAGTGQDGDFRAGKTLPDPRFTDNGNGTVTDNLTGLIWLKNANCFEMQYWSSIIPTINALASGSCGLSDGSQAGDWRIPNSVELASLTEFSTQHPALAAGNPFVNVQTYYYWSSSTGAYDYIYQLYDANWVESINDGYLGWGSKHCDRLYTLPVRGGQ